MYSVKAFLFTLLVLLVGAGIQLAIFIPFKYFIGTPDDFTHLYGVTKIIATIGSFLIIYVFFWKPKLELRAAFNVYRYQPKIYLYLPILGIGLFLFDKPFWDIEKMLLVYQNGSEVDVLFSETRKSSIYDVFSILIISPIIEELLFRKFLLGKLLEKNKVFTALLISSLCFSLIHFESPNNVMPAFFGGIVLGLIYLKTRMIGYSIAFHFLFNLILIVTLNFEVSSTNWLLGYNFDCTYWLLSGIGLLLVVLGVKRIWMFKDDGNGVILK